MALPAGRKGLRSDLVDFEGGIDDYIAEVAQSEVEIAWGNITGTLADQTDLKDAFDAINSSSSPLFMWKNFEGQYTVPANSNGQIKASDFGYEIPTGYAPCGIISYSSGNNNCMVRTVSVSSDASDYYNMIIHNYSSSEGSGKATMRVVFVKSSFIKQLS